MTEENARTYGETPLLARFRGCLLGGTVGDALGAPVEFWSRSEILKQFGPDGVRDYIPAYGRIGAITDDTQMTLFTADALLRGYIRMATKRIGVHGLLMRHGYLRWYRTQGYRHRDLGDDGMNGWLLTHRALFDRRAPGNTCLSALRASQVDGVANNTSKGCGTVMRVAPIGLYAHVHHGSRGPEQAFALGMDCSRITHGHITATLSAGFLSALIAAICLGQTLDQAIETCIVLLRAHDGHDETLAAIDAACRAARRSPNSADSLASLGEGWVAEEALAIALYCALGCTDFESALSLAVSHEGDSDSTGAIVGNILGALHGDRVIPERWLTPLELRDVIRDIADDLANHRGWPITSWSSPDSGIPDTPEGLAQKAQVKARDDEQARIIQRYPPG